MGGGDHLAGLIPRQGPRHTVGVCTRRTKSGNKEVGEERGVEIESRRHARSHREPIEGGNESQASGCLGSKAGRMCGTDRVILIEGGGC